MPPSSEHEALHRVFQYDEVLFARSLANILGKPVPAPIAVSVLNIDLTETRPLERRADTVLLAKYQENGVLKKYILIIESQTEEKKERRRRWPYYIAYLQDKYDCPVVLLVVCSKKETAEWAREPIVVGLPGLVSMTVTPVVLGPDNPETVGFLAEYIEDGARRDARPEHLEGTDGNSDGDVPVRIVNSLPGPRRGPCGRPSRRP